MSEKPLVSFVMGVYNTKNLDDLKRSVESMLKQTYENIEVVICNDCSTNGVYEYLVDNYGNNKKITLLRNSKNEGASVARNNALAVAEGEYVAIQDDDDYSDLTRIEKQVSFLENNPEYALVSSGLAKFDADGIWSKIMMKEIPDKRDFKRFSQHIHAATLFRKECLNAVNGYRIAPETARGEDYDLFMRIYAYGMRGYNLQEVLYFYNFNRDLSRHIKYKYKINEAIIRFKGFKALKLPLIDYVFVFRPLLAGILSERIKQKIKQIRGNKNENNIYQ